MNVFAPSDWPLWASFLGLAVAAGIIGWAGVHLARAADRFADRTGLGEALTGSIVLGLMTALPGLAASITAALDGRPALAIANALGGIAIQTVFLAVADLFHRRANLEHAAASLPNMMQTGLLVLLLVLVVLGLSSPESTVVHVHPISLLLIATAVGGAVLVIKTRAEPMWRPQQTDATVPDQPDDDARDAALLPLLSILAAGAVAVVIAGIFVARVTAAIADETGLSDSVAGGLLSGVTTSLPELVTTVAAVRRGALTLAVSDIVGGNFFDVLFVVAADFVYLGGSLYHAEGIGASEIFLAGLTVLLNVVLLLGLLYRQREGPGNIGVESVLMIALYLVGYAVLTLVSW